MLFLRVRSHVTVHVSRIAERETARHKAHILAAADAS